MGYEKKDLINHVPFEFHHHEDVEANLECSRGRKYLKTLRVCVCVLKMIIIIVCPVPDIVRCCF